MRAYTSNSATGGMLVNRSPAFLGVVAGLEMLTYCRRRSHYAIGLGLSDEVANIRSAIRMLPINFRPSLGLLVVSIKVPTCHVEILGPGPCMPSPKGDRRLRNLLTRLSWRAVGLMTPLGRAKSGVRRISCPLGSSASFFAKAAAPPSSHSTCGDNVVEAARPTRAVRGLWESLSDCRFSDPLEHMLTDD